MPTSDLFSIAGDFSQAGTGHLIIDAAMSGYERVNITGSAALAGTLTVRSPAGQGAWAYDAVRSFASYSGTFDTYVLPSGYTHMFVSPPMPGQPWKLRIQRTMGGP